MAQIIKRVALLVGSSRAGGNGAGLATWLSPIVQSRLNHATEPQSKPLSYEVVVVDPTTPPHPFGPVVDGTRMPSQIRNPAEYSSESVREWSKFVSSCSAFVILTPEYNGGYPGELKNAIDHIFWEWRDKAAMVVAYGGGGGSRSAAQLKDVLKSVRLRQVSKPVLIKLPKGMTGGETRVPSGEDYPDFLTEYIRPVEEATDELSELILEQRPEQKL